MEEQFAPQTAKLMISTFIWIWVISLHPSSGHSNPRYPSCYGFFLLPPSKCCSLFRSRNAPVSPTSLTENTKLTPKLFPQRIPSSEFCHSTVANFHKELKLSLSLLPPIQFFWNWTVGSKRAWQMDRVRNRLNLVSLGKQAWKELSVGSSNSDTK